MFIPAMSAKVLGVRSDVLWNSVPSFKLTVPSLHSHRRRHSVSRGNPAYTLPVKIWDIFRCV